MEKSYNMFIQLLAFHLRYQFVEGDAQNCLQRNPKLDLSEIWKTMMVWFNH